MGNVISTSKDYTCTGKVMHTTNYMHPLQAIQIAQLIDYTYRVDLMIHAANSYYK